MARITPFRRGSFPPSVQPPPTKVTSEFVLALKRCSHNHPEDAAFSACMQRYADQKAQQRTPDASDHEHEYAGDVAGGEMA